MAIFRVQAPDGSILRIEGPDDATPAQIEAFAAQQAAPKGKSWEEKVQFERGKAQEQQMQETPLMDRFLAGMGKSFKDTGTGISQLLGRTKQSEVDEERRLSQPLMDDVAGVGGNLAGTIAQSVAIPGGSTIKGAALTNAALAGAQPVATGESRAFNTGLGAAGGAAGATGAKVVGKVFAGPKNVLTPAERELAAKAEAMGINLTPGQATGNKFLRTLESTLERMPATSAKATEKAAEQGKQFTMALTKQMGASADNLGEDVMSANKARLGAQYESIFRDAKIDLGEAPLSKLSDIADEASRFLTPGDAKIVLNRIDDIIAKVGDDGAIEGRAYQKWRSSANSSNGDVNRYLKQARGAMDEAAAEALGPEKMALYNRTNLEYKNMKRVVKPIAEKSTTGQASPGLVLERVRAAYPNMAFEGAGKIGDLAKIGKAFLKEPYGDSGTAQRQLAQALLTGGTGVGAGGITGAVTGDPMLGLGVAAGTMASRSALPKMAQALLESKAMQSYMRGGMAPKDVDPRLIELLMKGGSALPFASWNALSQ